MARASVLLVLLSIVCIANTANVLLLAGLPSPSHHIWFRALAYGLANIGGHNVTVLSVDTEKNPPPNVHYIHIENIYDTIYGSEDIEAAFNLTETVMQDMSPFEELSGFSEFGALICSTGFKSNGMKTILNYPDNFKFDVVIHDYTIGPCLLFLLTKFNYPPLVGATAFLDPPYTLDLVGGHKHYAYIPFYNVNYDSDMNFRQRVTNVLLYALSFLYQNYQLVPQQDQIVRDNVNFDVPYLGDLQKRTVLALVNTHPSFDVAEPLPPNVIPVGGLQIEEPKPLPNDLEEFIQQAPKGAVLFSLGTNVKSDALGADVQIKLLKAFEQMPQYHFLWKFETDTLPMKLPKNVLVRPWMPQNDLLGHPKILLFITHSGGLSTIEASWHGMPLVAIPFMADQHKNTFKSVKSGVAEKIDFLTLSTESVKSTVLKVIEEPSYRRKMKLRSARFHDQPEKPLERAVWWIDYVIRNPSPDHIQSPTLKLGFIRSNIYDILALLLALVLVVFYMFYKLISLFRRKTVVKVKRS